MTLEQKRAAAIKFALSVGTVPNGLDDDLVTEDFLYWAHGIGTIDKETFRRLIVTMKPLFASPVQFHIAGTTAEGDRIAIEADGDGTLTNGTPYRNKYHFLAVFRGDKIQSFKEYYDSKYSAEIFGPALAALPRGPQ